MATQKGKQPLQMRWSERKAQRKNVDVFFLSSSFLTRSKYETVHLVFGSAVIINHNILRVCHTFLKSFIAVEEKRTMKVDSYFFKKENI